LVHWAIYQDKVKMVCYLLNRGVDVNASDNRLATAVHWAAIRGQHHIIPLLIERNARTDDKDINGKTPLDVAKEGSFVQTRCVAELQKEQQSPTTLWGMRERALWWWGVFLGFAFYWSLIAHISSLLLIPLVLVSVWLLCVVSIALGYVCGDEQWQLCDQAYDGS
jgi:Ankyrin repeats (3 copies)